MNLPKLKIRPVSQQSVAKFGGINHHPTAPIGTWWDSRNLSSDLSPTLVCRRQRTLHISIDGNSPTVPIVAMCGGDHIVLLDETGTFWCNGHSQQVDFPSDVPGLGWYIAPVPGHEVQANLTITPRRGAGTDWNVFNGLGVDPLLHSITQQYIQFRCTEVHDPETHQDIRSWECDFGTSPQVWTSVELSDYNITVDGDNDIDGLYIRLYQYYCKGSLLSGGHRLVRMGAWVVDPKSKVWIDAVKLSTGDALTEGDDYGVLDVGNYYAYDTLTLTMCDIDGNPYSGVVVSATEPTQDGYWLDTSGSETVLREWSVSSSVWITIASTFVRIKHTLVIGADDLSGEVYEGIKVHDAVELNTDVPSTTDESVKQLLNSWHYIYGDITENGVREIIVSGILPSDTVTVTKSSSEIFRVGRPVPTMDFVVECGNRLWGCRYDEANSINEIYASALGDPTNWHVFQGLSTDSWTASRGVAAPFTGAAVLDGHPLFFREESLEKVYPSSTGAHQIQTFDLEGVEDGAADSLCVIEDRLYYKSRGGVMVYTGSIPRRISDAFGDMVFRGGSGARHQMKYCLSTNLQGATEEPVVLVLDLKTGDWHIDDEAWLGLAVTWKDDLYYIEAGRIESMAEGPVYGRESWYAETAPQAIHYDSASRSLTEHKWVSYLRVRFRMLQNGTRQPNKLRIYIAYEDGDWQLLREFVGSGVNILKTWEMNLLPRRKDNFRLRFEGSGPTQIFDVAWRMERSEGGH